MILDATLREGVQSPAARPGPARRTALLRGLAAAGIAEAEIGWAAPGSGRLPRLVEEARAAAPGLRLWAWTRARAEDVDDAVASGADVVHICVPASDLHLSARLGRSRAWAAGIIGELVPAVLAAGRAASVGFEDATRADPRFLDRLVAAAARAGADRIRLSDTIGAASPAGMADLVRRARAGFAGRIGVHCHDDFGLGTGNAIAALDAGADWADGCLLGGGERAGLARTEALAAYLAVHRGAAYDLRALPGLCRVAARLLGRRIPAHAPVVGPAIWSVSSGIHCHGLARDARTYEPFPAAAVAAAPDYRDRRLRSTG